MLTVNDRGLYKPEEGEGNDSQLITENSKMKESSNDPYNLIVTHKSQNMYPQRKSVSLEPIKPFIYTKQNTSLFVSVDSGALSV